MAVALSGAALAGAGSPTDPLLADPLPAFPGALGYGRIATGWRGGEVVAVTNLRDRGPGSLRACAGRKGRGRAKGRVCVFRVSGTIRVDRTIRVASRTYIAGQTSPGGVQLRLGAAQNTPLAVRDATDVVVRHLALRPGPSRRPSPNVDAIIVEDARRVYLDHLSLAFATDENLNVHSTKAETADITVAHSIVALGLDRANHPKGGHSKGALICSGKPGRARCGRITLFANLFAHNRDRNPDVKATATGPVEVLGNVFYNPRSQFGEFYDLLGDTRIRYHGNLALAGPSTRERPRPAAVEGFSRAPAHVFAIDAHDNRASIPPVCGSGRSGAVIDGTALPFLGGRWTGSGAVPPPAYVLPERVLREAGARTALTPSGLDRLDARVVADVRRCSGRVIDRAAQVGGWPEQAVLPPPPDTDGDGMPDAWEARRGLDPHDAKDAWTPLETGLPGSLWPALELYLEERAAARRG